VDLTEPILSRFDILCVIRDRVDVIADEQLAEHVVASHIRSHPLATTDEKAFGKRIEAADLLDQDTLRKYIAYARMHVKPQIGNVSEEKLVRVYTELRRESLVGGGVSVGVRHLESIIR
jgi:DNA replication licensing factor MCM2